MTDSILAFILFQLYNVRECLKLEEEMHAKVIMLSMADASKCIGAESLVVPLEDIVNSDVRDTAPLLECLIKSFEKELDNGSE